MAEDSTILKHYDLDNLETYSDRLDRYGKIDKLTGAYIFTDCEGCKGPLFAHKTCLVNEKTLIWTEEQRELIVTSIIQNPIFQASLAKFDDRITVSTCDLCQKNLGSRSKKENHMRILHRMLPPQPSQIVFKDQEIPQNLIPQHIPPQQPKSPPMLVKTPEIPIWSRLMKFDYYKSQIAVWDLDNQESDKRKFDRVVESYKKNDEIPGLKTFATTIILSKLRTKEKQKVSEILKLLEERFGRTKVEKFDALVNIMKNEFKVSSSDDEQSYWDKCANLLTDVQELDLKKNINMFLIRWMIVTGKEGKMITETDDKSFKKDLKVVNDEDILLKFEEIYRQEKIEGNRESKNKQTSESFYTKQFNNQERPRTFSNRRNSQSDRFSGRGRSSSRFSNGRNRSRSRNESQQRDRSSSRFSSRGSDGIRSLQAKVESQDKRIKILEKVLKEKKIIETNFVNRDLEEEKEIHKIDMYFTKYKSNGKKSVVDNGAPLSIVGNPWLDKYLEENALTRNDLKSDNIEEYFTFGPSEVYESNTRFEIPIMVKDKSGRKIKTFVKACEVDTEVPLLMGKNTLKELGCCTDHKKNILKCDDIIENEKIEFDLEQTSGGHDALKLESIKEDTEERTVSYIMAQVSDDSVSHVLDYKNVKRIHEVTNHKQEENMIHAYRNAGIQTDGARKIIRRVIDNCKVCKKFKRSFGIPKVSLPKSHDFNEVIAIDLKQMGKKFILWMICTFSRFIKGVVINNKEADTVMNALQNGWNLNYGYPSKGFYADNGLEFHNDKLLELASKMNISLSFGPPYSPWGNSINERNHYSADVTVSKVLESDPRLDLQTAVNLASWTHNTNINKLGYTPMHLATGKSVIFPGIAVGNKATDSLTEHEVVRKIVERHPRVTEEFRKAEYLNKLKFASKTRVKSFNNRKYEAGDKVYYQSKNDKGWLGPAEVFGQKNNEVWLWANGDLRRVNICKVQPFSDEYVDEDSKDEDNSASVMKSEHGKPSDDRNFESESVSEHIKASHDTNSESDSALSEDDSKIDGVRMTRLKAKEIKSKEVQFEGSMDTLKDKKNDDEEFQQKCADEVSDDRVATYFMKIKDHECFDPLTNYVVELPVREHWRPEVLEAKTKELENLKLYETYEIVEDVDQERISMRWVITTKEKHDGQKTACKARLVARGFQEAEKPPSDSPTTSRDSVKIFMAVSANKGFQLRAIDIRAAFLQAEPLKREVFIQPPKDVAEEGKIWKLLKPIYGLDDASRRFWITVKKIFKEFKLNPVTGDEAFYMKHVDGNLVGIVASHVDDFLVAGTAEFVDELTSTVMKYLTISKIEDKRFRFTGIDVEQGEDTITLSMEDYASSIDAIKEIRKGKKTEPLTKIELKIFRKMTGKISWLAENCRPDLSFYALDMSKKNNNATLGDLLKVNKVIQKIKGRTSKVVFRKVGEPKELIVFGIGDASYKSDEKAIGGEFVCLGNKDSNVAVPLFWKSKTIRQVCHSAKDAETRLLVKLVDTTRSFTDQLEELFFGARTKTIPIKLFTDSLPTLESIASTKQVEQRLLRNSYTELKERLENGEILMYVWLDTNDMLADILTKDSKDNIDVHDVTRENKFWLGNVEDNMVAFNDGEITIKNRREKNKEGREKCL